MFIRPEIVITGDGSPTLVHPVFKENYHSLNGAMQESMHVFIRNGLEKCIKTHVKILEIGFGSGLNALLTLKAARDRGISVWYTAVELYPLDEATVKELAYAQDTEFIKIHETDWNKPVAVEPGFILEKINSDLEVTEFETKFDLVYFDAFSPDTQPDLWSRSVFGKIFESMSDASALVTYSAKGDVKRTLREIGFEVLRLKGAPGKRHMLRAVKNSIKKI